MMDRIMKEIRKDRKVEKILASFMKIVRKNKIKKCAEI